MATFTYQVAYWGWVYLEKEEIKKERTGVFICSNDGFILVYMLIDLNSRNWWIRKAVGRINEKREDREPLNPHRLPKIWLRRILSRWYRNDIHIMKSSHWRGNLKRLYECHGRRETRLWPVFSRGTSKRVHQFETFLRTNQPQHNNAQVEKS